MAQKKKRAPWGSKKRAQVAAEAAEAGEDAARDIIGGEIAPNGHAPGHSLGEAVEHVKNWLEPFEPNDRKKVLRAVAVLLK
jgi:hypothetical protein